MMPTHSSALSLPVMKKLSLLLITLPLFSHAADLRQQLIGDWTYTDPQGCRETVSFRADGALHITSRDQRIDGRYTAHLLDLKALDKLGPRWVSSDTPFDMTQQAIRADTSNATVNDAADCLGNTETSGPADDWSSYLFFDKPRSAFVFCDKGSLPCIGPYERQTP